MVSVDKVEKGIGTYLDEQLMPKLPVTGLYKVLIGTGVSISVKRIGKAIDNLKTNPVLNSLELVDKDGNIDVDIVITELKKQIPQEGLKLQYNKFGNLDITITQSDLEEVLRCIKTAK